MVAEAIAIACVSLILLGGESLWHRQVLKGEFARKFIHTLTGCFVASWGFFLPWQSIVGIAMLFLGVVIFARVLKGFPSIYSVPRRSYGDIFYPIGIGIAALITRDNEWAFAAAILIMALADGLAALIGVKYGKQNKITFLGNTKSVAGSTAFFICSLTILTAAFIAQTGSVALAPLPLVLIVVLASLLSGILTIVEAISPHGSDNVSLPIAASILVVLLFPLA